MNGRHAPDMEGFELGTPALVCRWRLARRRLPLENRHLRALLARTVNERPVSQALVAWAKQHIEWTLEEGSAEHPDGVLMLIIDDNDRAAMTAGPYQPLEDARLAALARRARWAQVEASTTGIAPETLWLVIDDELVWNPGEGCAASGAASLVVQLAQTIGIPVRREDELLERVAYSELTYDEAFLVSDEHGIVVAEDAAGPYGRRFAEGYERLRQSTRG